MIVQCSCGKKLRGSEEFAGKRIKCPACGAFLAIPKQQPADEPAGNETVTTPRNPGGPGTRLLSCCKFVRNR